VIALAGAGEAQRHSRALEGDYIDVLITDYPTARSLLKANLG
jgi:DNA-binding transcriptional regulator LsrR (DeoR family)